MHQADVEKYIRKVSPGEDAVLTAMERYARHRRFPIIGPLAGRLLYQLTLMTNARRVLELGSGFGYSAYWFALAMGRSGRITMIDYDPANLERAREYFKQGNLKTGRVFIAGDALTAVATLTGPYDIIFTDIDKHEYPETINIAARLLKKGGLFVTDNVLWSGRVFDPRVRDRTTQAIRRFTADLYADRRFFTTIIPIRDGLSVAVRQ
jgi:predicted O-methyltransferase YrrM